MAFKPLSLKNKEQSLLMKNGKLNVTQCNNMLYFQLSTNITLKLDKSNK